MTLMEQKFWDSIQELDRKELSIMIGLAGRRLLDLTMADTLHINHELVTVMAARGSEAKSMFDDVYKIILEKIGRTGDIKIERREL